MVGRQHCQGCYISGASHVEDCPSSIGNIRERISLSSARYEASPEEQRSADIKAQKQMKITEGGLVRFRTGDGPLMVVSKGPGDRYECHWFDASKRFRSALFYGWELIPSDTAVYSEDQVKAGFIQAQSWYEGSTIEKVQVEQFLEAVKKS